MYFLPYTSFILLQHNIWFGLSGLLNVKKTPKESLKIAPSFLHLHDWKSGSGT